MGSKSLGVLTLDLIVATGGFESGMDRAARTADQKTRQIERMAQERAKSIELAFGNMARAIAGPLAAAFSVGAIAGFVQNLAAAQQQADKLRNSLTYSAGSAAGAAKELGYLRDVSRTLGMDFNSAAQAYAKFAAATKGTGITAAQTKDVFEGIAAASAKLGLSSDETGGALLALSQMASKGTVQAEELRGQLGERLPGALKIAAQAMGVTQAELGKMMETGQLLASDFLPKFGAALKTEFAGSVNSLTMEINRLNSAWDIWKQSFSNSSGSGFKWITDGLNEASAAMRELGSDAGVTMKILAAIQGFQKGGFGLWGGPTSDTVQAQAEAFQNLAVAKKKVQELEAQEQKYGSLPPITARRLASLKAEEAALRDEINALAMRRGKETGITLPDLAGDYAAQKAKADERLNGYMAQMGNAPKSVKIAAEVEKENKAFELAVAGLQNTDARYIKALSAHNQRVAEIQRVPAAKVAVSEGSRLIESLKERLITTENLTEVEKLQAQFADSKYPKMTAGEKGIALGIAEQIDARKSLNTELDAELVIAKKLTAEYDRQDARLKSLVAGTDIGKNTQNMLDEALAESALRSGSIDTGTYDQIIEKMHEVKDAGKDTFKELQDAIEGWGKQSAGAIADFCTTGKLSFGDMAKSIINDMIKMAIQQSVTGPLFKAIGGWATSLITPNADGGVYNSPGLSAYSGQVVSKPTLFPFARGMGLMGEAGPEAILPLSRSADGKLGVKGGGSGDVQVNITINSTEGTTKQNTAGDTSGAWTQFAGRMKNMILEQMVNEKRPGGLLYS